MDFWAYLSLALLGILFLSGSPLAVAFGLAASIIALGAMGIPLSNLSQVFFAAVDSYPLIACPFFILAGYLLIGSGGMEPVRDLMQAWFGHLRGGYAVATVVFAAFVGAISGSSAACCAILATVALPVLLEAGYDRPFSAALVTTTGELGLLIPPSIYLIIFGAQNYISIAELFAGGVGSGLLMAAFMVVVVVIRSRKRKYPIAALAPWRDRGISTLKSLPVMFMPVIILGGIYGGIFSPTQAAAVAVFYILAIGALVYRKLTWARIMTSLVETVKISSMIYLLIIAAGLIGMMFAYLRLPQIITDVVTAMDLGPLAFLLVVEVVLLVMGFFFSSLPMVIVVLPLFMASVYELGIDPVFYGVIGVMCAMIGDLTPPFGPQLWIGAPLCKESLENILREAWAFVGAMTLSMVVVTFVPGIIMFLVNLYRSAY